MNEANWTPSPADERNRAAIRNRNRHEDALLVLFAGAASSGALLMVFFALTKPWGPLTVLLGLGLLACVGTVAFVARRNRELIREMNRNERGLVEEFGGEGGWLVDLILLQGAAPTGEDRGMLWLEDGRLLFSGYRTSFALSPNDAVGKCVRVVAAKGLRHPSELPLKVRTAAGPMTLSLKFDPLQAGAAQRDLKAWANLPSEGRGQIPPRVAGPDAPSRLALFVRAISVTAFWAFFLTLVPAVLPQIGIKASWGIVLFLFVLVVLLSLPLGCTYPVRRWRAWWNRRRVADPVSNPTPSVREVT